MSAASEEEYSKDKLLEMVREMESKIEKIKTTDTTSHVKDEINLAEGYFEVAKKMMKKKHFEEAYFQIKISAAYMELINAKIKLAQIKQGKKEE
jgi:hypothetical protein